MTNSPHDKQYTLFFQQRDGYLYALVEGEHDNYEISRAYWQEVADEVGRLGIRRVLIEENIPESGTLADAFQLGSEIRDMGFGNARIAFVDRYVEQNEINEFGELVAVNRGVNGKLFEDVQSAEEWLAAGNHDQ